MVIEIMKDITLMWHNLLLLVTCNENNTRRNCGRPAFFTATIPPAPGIVFSTPWLIPVFTRPFTLSLTL